MSAPINPLPDAARILGAHYTAGPLEKAGGSITGGAALTWTAHIAGLVDGVPIRVGVSGGRRSVVLIYGATFPQLGRMLDVRRRTATDALRWRPGRRHRSIRTDGGGRLTVWETVEDSGSDVLTPGAVDTIGALVERLPNAVVSDSTVDGAERRSLYRLPDPAEVADVVERCVAVAAALWR